MLNQVKKVLNRVKRQRGQGMTEYIVIVALVGLGSLAAYSFFGQSIRAQTSQMADQVAGAASTKGQTNAVSAASSAEAEGTSQVNMKTYDTHANGG